MNKLLYIKIVTKIAVKGFKFTRVRGIVSLNSHGMIYCTLCAVFSLTNPEFNLDFTIE